MGSHAVQVALLVVLSLGVGFMIGRMTADSTLPFSDDNQAATETTGTSGGAGTTADGNVEVTTANLTEGQRKLLESLGIDANEITITKEMITCAEAKLGAARVEEIKNGATPSFTEGAKLVACYQ